MRGRKLCEFHIKKNQIWVREKESRSTEHLYGLLLKATQNWVQLCRFYTEIKSGVVVAETAVLPECMSSAL